MTKTIEILETPSVAKSFLRALSTGAKHPGLVKNLARVELALPQVVLDAEHIARYGALCGFSASQGVPLVYPQLLTFPLVMAYMNSKACPWPALGVIHLANSIEQRCQLRAGDKVRVELGSGSLFTHDKGQGFTLDLRILRGDELVWSASQSLLSVGVQEKWGTPYTSQLAAGADLSCQTELSASGDIGRRYGVVSGDRNPIHLTPLTARLFGYSRPIAHGMWTKARALSYLLPPEPLERASVAVEFKTPLPLPGVATLWTQRFSNGASFEVRDHEGMRPHLRGELQY